MRQDGSGVTAPDCPIERVPLAPTATWLDDVAILVRCLDGKQLPSMIQSMISQIDTAMSKIGIATNYADKKMRH